MTMITPSYLGETIEYSSLHACRSTLEDPTDGTPIVVLMKTRQIMRIEGSRNTVHADLSDVPAEYLNDMVVDAEGRAYVDLLRKPPSGSPEDSGDCIMLVELNGQKRVVATGELYRPNGLAISGDGSTLVVAEGPKHRLTAFSVDRDGSLHNRRVYAETGLDEPDGICLDAEGAVWIGSPRTNQFLRIREGGETVQSIRVEGKWAVACVLGGPARRTLFMGTARVPADPLRDLWGNLERSEGFIETVSVDVPGDGLP